MTRQLGLVTFAVIIAILGAACATRSFVTEQVRATEGKLTERVSSTESRLTERVSSTENRLSEQVQSTESRLSDQVRSAQTTLTQRVEDQEAQLREAAERMRANRATIDAVGALAGGAKAGADAAAATARDAELRLAQRIAERNKYRLVETRFVYFDVGQADLRREDIKELEEVASALKADANAILEIHGFADPRGSDRYNNELARDRADAVIRYLVQHHGIELRQVRSAAMGKTALTAGAKPGPDIYAMTRRVDLRLLAPWSSWEDRQSQTVDDVAASPATTAAGPRPAAITPRDVLTQDGPWREIVDKITRAELGATD